MDYGPMAPCAFAGRDTAACVASDDLLPVRRYNAMGHARNFRLSDSAPRATVKPVTATCVFICFLKRAAQNKSTNFLFLTDELFLSLR